MKEKILIYITHELISDKDAKISSNEDLLSSGVLDSISAMKLIAFIEKTFEIKVDPEDMVIENFMDVDSMETFINDKKSTAD
ncbi:MAG: acyl carrier protein [Bacteroidota bacterium]